MQQNKIENRAKSGTLEVGLAHNMWFGIVETNFEAGFMELIIRSVEHNVPYSDRARSLFKQNVL